MNRKSFCITSCPLVLVIVLLLAVASCKKSESALPVLSIAEQIQISEGTESSIKAIITVSLSVKSKENVTLRWSTNNGTAMAGEDYMASTDETVVFSPGKTLTQIEIEIVNDDVFEADEHFFVTIVNVQNASLGNSQCKVIILNDDVFIPELIIPSALNISEGNEILKIIAMPIKLSGPTTNQVSMKWSTADGTAKAGQDYEIVTNRQLVFEPGETEKNIEVGIIGDDIFEMDDTFLIQFTELINCIAEKTEIAVTILNDDVFTPTLAGDGFITPLAYPGMELVWNDEFDEPAINTNWWTHETGAGGWGNNELQSYTTSSLNSYIQDSKLHIVATKLYSSYSSARLITKGKKEFRYGRIDIRAKMPYGQGIWPALWMLGGNISQVGWPRCGEIDIMEYLGHQESTTHGTVHYFNAGHRYTGSHYTLPGGQSFNDLFHIFTIVWQENSIKWYVDYNQFFEIKSTDIIYDAFRLPHFFIFNVAVGGNWPGYPNETTVFPQTMIVDYVRVFQ